MSISRLHRCSTARTPPHALRSPPQQHAMPSPAAFCAVVLASDAEPCMSNAKRGSCHQQSHRSSLTGTVRCWEPELGPAHRWSRTGASLSYWTVAGARTPSLSSCCSTSRCCPPMRLSWPACQVCAPLSSSREETPMHWHRTVPKSSLASSLSQGPGPHLHEQQPGLCRCVQASPPARRRR